MHHRGLHFAVLLLAELPCFGCGTKFSDVHGKVALLGTPIDKGTIAFVPAGGLGPTAAGRIKEGLYSVPVLPGQYKVRISGFRKVGEHRASVDPNSPMKEISEEIVPPRYNTATTLIREIKPGEQEEDFELN